MQYYGKKFLYNFLKSKGYKVPMMKHMEYEKYRGTEWLKTHWSVKWEEDSLDIRLTSLVYGGRILISTYEYDEETDKDIETIYEVYLNDKLIHKANRKTKVWGYLDEYDNWRTIDNSKKEN
jgi:hypothetical protein